MCSTGDPGTFYSEAGCRIVLVGKKEKRRRASEDWDEYEGDVGGTASRTVRQSIEEDTERRWNQVIIYEFHRAFRPINIRYRFCARSPLVMKATGS